MSHLQNHPELAKELDRHRALKAVTDGWVQRFESDLLEDTHRRSPLTRFEVVFGLFFSLFGLILLAIGGWAQGLFFMVIDPEVPVWLKIGSLMIAIGFTVLFASVIRWRMTTFKKDPYKEIIR